jgi:hypothetical protein
MANKQLKIRVSLSGECLNVTDVIMEMREFIDRRLGNEDTEWTELQDEWLPEYYEGVLKKIAKHAEAVAKGQASLQDFAHHYCLTETAPDAHADKHDVWQPIETAPKGDRILLYDPQTGVPDFGSWHGSGYWCYEGVGIESKNYPPTHWMPSPAAPEEGGAA